MTLRSKWLATGLAGTIAVGCAASIDDESESISSIRSADGSWVIHAIGKRCWDLGNGASAPAGGSPVTLRTCNSRSPSQQIRVYELADGTHDVMLAVPTGSWTMPPSLCVTANGPVKAGTPLIVATCHYDLLGRPFPMQRFSYDGDAVMMGSQELVDPDPDWSSPDGRPQDAVARDFVVEPANDATTDGVPLVVGTREVSMAESFRMTPITTTFGYPTTGFKLVSALYPQSPDVQLDAALANGWGTVVQIDSSAPFVLVSGHELRAGETIRGYRGALDDGPVVQTLEGAAPDELLVVPSSHVRITGLRLVGTSEKLDEGQDVTHGVFIEENAKSPVIDVLVDHVQAYAWTGAALSAEACAGGECPAASCPALPGQSRPNDIRFVANFLHQNVAWGHGYGAAVGHGAYAQIARSVMYGNRHSVTANSDGQTGYLANDNFVLSDAPDYNPFRNVQPDFDKHGSDNGSEHYGGISDDSVRFDNNTFLGTNRWNIIERGTPCGTTTITRNRFRRRVPLPFQTCGASDAVCTQTEDLSHLDMPISGATGNHGMVDDPTDRLAVGDFDGDGHDDVFVATGNTWWFSSGGQSEWRYLNAQPEQIDDLRFGDLDGDGRTDVIAVHGLNLDVSWGGESAWTTINSMPIGTSITDILLGDFNGDHITDVLMTGGGAWFTASGGMGWQVLATFSQRAKDLRVGDFDGDGRTDILGNIGSGWSIVRGGTHVWAPWQPSFTFGLDGVYIGDFNGDGKDDAVRAKNGRWEVAHMGMLAFVPLRTTSDSLDGKPIGRFDGDPRADVLGFSDLHLFRFSGGTDPAVNHSIHDLR